MNPERHIKEIRVRKEHLDNQEHVNNVRYVQWIQDVAEEHWKLRANEEHVEKYAWVVIRHEIDYKKEAKQNDLLKLETFIGKTSTFKSIRHVIIINAETEAKIVSAQTTWCLLDAKKRKPVPIPEELMNIFCE